MKIKGKKLVSKSGKVLGKHKSKKAAKAQIGAIKASEKKRR